VAVVIAAARFGVFGTEQANDRGISRYTRINSL